MVLHQLLYNFKVVKFDGNKCLKCEKSLTADILFLTCCGHLFCAECIQDHIASQSMINENICCPQCSYRIEKSKLKKNVIKMKIRRLTRHYDREESKYIHSLTKYLRNKEKRNIKI